MSIDIPRHFVKQFGAGIDLLQQQMGSNLREGVDVDTNVTPGDRKFYDQLDAIDMVDIADQHGDTTILDVPHRRRMVTPSASEWGALIDRADLRRVLNDPTNGYVQTAAAAAGRRIDDHIVSAFFASANTGVDGGTPVAFPGGDFLIAAVAGGLTIGQMRQAREVLEANENPEDGERNRWYAALTARQRRDLLATTEVTSSDFSVIKALVGGQITEFLGFSYLKSERLAVTGGDTRCPFWRKSSMKAAIAQEGRSFIDERPDKRNSVQIRYELDSGASRCDEKGVVEVRGDLA